MHGLNQPEEALVSPVEPAWRASPVVPEWRLILFMVLNSSVQHVAREMFHCPFESFIPILSHAKCVHNQSTKLDGINVPKSGSMVTKYFPAIAKMKCKLYATKIYRYLLMTRLDVTHYRLVFCVTIMSLCSTINHILLLIVTTFF